MRKSTNLSPKWYKKPLPLVLICAVAICIVIWLNRTVEETPPQQNSEIQANDNSLESLVDRDESQYVKAAQPEITYQNCKTITSQLGGLHFNWARKNYHQWIEFMEQGYSFDEITLAIEYFTNSNFAASFRIEHLQKNAQLTKKNQELNQTIFEMLPSLKEVSGLSFAQKVPSDSLAQFAQMNDEDRQIVLESASVSVDDVAFFIYESDMSDELILELLTALKDPKGTLGYAKLEIVSLLDYAVVSGRNSVAEALLDRGLTPTQDFYLGSTMEWALVRLFRSKTKPQLSAAIEMIQRLQNFNATARFSQRDENLVEGSFPRFFYQFDAQKIDHLRTEFGFDLTQLAEKPTPTIDTDHPLISELAQQRGSYVTQQTDFSASNETLEACHNKLQEVNNAWNPEDPKNLLNRLLERYHDSQQDVEAALLDLDPRIMDEYRQSQRSESWKIEPVDGMGRVHKLLTNGEINQAIQQLQNSPLSEGNKNWFSEQILMYSGSYYDELQQTGMLEQDLPYSRINVISKFQIASLEALLAAGAPIKSSDIYGKTLMYYAVKRANPEVLRWMIENQFPFYGEAGGEDPLHTAINPTLYRNTPPILWEKIDALMQLSPRIDQFHLQRMALVKHQHPELYKKVVSKYPQLTVGTDTPLPTVTLNAF